jgi:rubrerythrin
MGESTSNLKAAFAGESQANRSYLAFSYKAQEEGLPLVAKRFRVAAASETIHALNHLQRMGGVNSTAENLEAAMGGENYEHTSMYPSFSTVAESEGDTAALESFHWANEAEKFHEKMFAEAAADLANVPDKKYFVCQWCGMTYEDDTPDACIVCGHPKEQIKEIV